MDQYCQQCGAPWEVAYITDDLPKDLQSAFYAGVGCEACKWGKVKPKRSPFRSELAAAMTDLMGDDIDGIAAMMEDAEFLMGDKFWD